jgi:hypothetical protein
MAQEGNFVVAQASKLMIHAGKSDEVLVRGLNSMTLPVGWSSTMTTISEFGVPVDIQVASGLTYDTVTCGGNFTLKDPTQAAFRKWALNATKVTDMRFYLDGCSFCALDLISNPGGYYQIGTMSAPTASKSDAYSFSVDIAPAGQSSIFENHRAGTSLTFAADTGTGATCTDADSLFVTNGFKVGQICYADHVDGLDPLILEISAVTASQLTFTQAVGNETSVPDFTGIATTKISSGEAMAFDSTSTTCA